MDTEITDLGPAGFRYAQILPDAALNAVFVHGFRGGHIGTWTWGGKRSWLAPWKGRPPGVLLHNLLHTHCKTPCNYFSVAHKASITSPTDIESAAGALRTFLDNYVLQDNDTPVVLIAHSFGGLACREAILRMLDQPGRLRIIGLLLMGTPNSGTEIARAASFFGSASGRNMTPYNDRLAALNREWAARIVNGGDPDREAHERAPLICWATVGTEDRVVQRESATALSSFANVEFISKTHIGLAKAQNEHDPTFVLITRFLREAEHFSRRRDGEWAIKELSYRLRRASLRSQWVKRDQMHIELRTSDMPHQFACRIVNKLEGGLHARRFSFCIYQSKLRPNETIDFHWEIGQGSMTEEAFSHMIEDNKSALEQYFRVTRLEVTQGGQQGEFTLSKTTTGPGWFMLYYDAPEWFSESHVFDSLELEVETFTDSRQGWMYYAVERTVTERLEVSFTAPFLFSTIARLGKGSNIADIVRSGSSYVSRAEVNGPVALGRNIVWIYQNACTHPTREQHPRRQP